ncbi:MAG: ATP-dependent DNA helicase RecG, partial [Jatrophihabitans endophyticus]|nr:ATP-dependent DNA helicase RecG [Jatrophihabitans endophyticus]
MATLETPLAEVVGGRTATALQKAFELATVGDLLGHYPRRLAERGELTPLRSLRIDDEVTVVADILTSQVKRFGAGARGGNSQRLEVTVGDGDATLQLVFFGKAAWRSHELVPGRRGLFSGKVGDFRGRRQLVHPDYLLLRGDERDDVEADVYAGRLIPVYPATQAVRTWTISSAVEQALRMLD